MDEASVYRMDYGSHLGPGTDSLHPHKGQVFETYDKYPGGSPGTFRGAWWYGTTDVYANLNGYYFETEQYNYQGIFWWSWEVSVKTLKKVTMMIRRRQGISNVL